MKKLLELKEQRKKTIASMEALVEGELTDEALASIETHKGEIATIDAQIVACNDVIDAVNSTPADRVLKESSLDRKDAEDTGIDFSSIKIPGKSSRSLSRCKVFKTDAEQRIAFAQGQQIRAMVGIQSAINWCSDNGLNLNAVHNENTNEEGGYLVLPEFDRSIIKLEEQFGVFEPAARFSPMTSDKKDRDRKKGGLTMVPVGESEAGTESTMAWDQVSLIRKDWMVLTRITNQLSADSIINIMDELALDVARASAQKKDQAGFIGDGTSTYHGVTGINTKLVDINGVDEGGGLILGAGNLMSEIIIGDFERMIGIVPEFPGIDEKWYCSKTFFANVMMRLLNAAGGNTIGILEAGPTGRSFLGIPVVISNVFPKTDANSQILCTLGDLSLSSDFGDREATTVAFSDSATIGGQNVFERNQKAVRWTEAWDINNHDLGTSTAAGPVVGLISAAS